MDHPNKESSVNQEPNATGGDSHEHSMRIQTGLHRHDDSQDSAASDHLGSAGTSYSAYSDNSAWTAYDWEAQDSSLPPQTKDTRAHPYQTHSRSNSHGKAKWQPFQANVLDGRSSRNWGWSSFLPPRNWTQRARIWIRHHMDHPGESRALPGYISENASSPLASASSTSSSSTFISDSLFHSRNHSTPVLHPSAFLSPEEYDKKRTTFGTPWSPLAPFGWARSHFPWPRMSWTRSTSKMTGGGGPHLLLTRRRRRGLQKLIWILSLMLVLYLGVYILAMLGKQGRQDYLENPMSAQDQALGKGKDPANPRARASHTHGGAPCEDAEPREISLSKGKWQGKVDSHPQQQQQTTFNVPPILDKPMIVEDPVDYYPDEDQDDLEESVGFVSWLSQATISGQHLGARTPFQQATHEMDRDIGQAHHPPERYLTFTPFAGITNQFYGMLRAMRIAQKLNRTLLLPPITASSHDKSRQNQAWSEFFDLESFKKRTGLRVIEYHDLRDQGGFRGPTGVRESGSAVGASWIPPELLRSKGGSDTSSSLAGALVKRGHGLGEQDRQSYQHSIGTGTGVVDMSLPCHVTCGFGSKRELDFTAKGFLRQWGFKLQKKMLPNVPIPSKIIPEPTLEGVAPPLPPLSPPDLPMDQTRDFERILQGLEDDSLKEESFLCVTNTYKIQMPVPPWGAPLVDSIEWREFGRHLTFQPKLVQFMEEFLDKTLGAGPETRAVYEPDTFWIRPPSSFLTPPAVPAASVPQSQAPQPPIQPPEQQQGPQSDMDTVPLPDQQAGVVEFSEGTPGTESDPDPPRLNQTTETHPIEHDHGQMTPLTKHTFFMIHVRRGDFETYCKKDFKDQRFAQCLPSMDAYADMIEQLQDRARNASSSSTAITAASSEDSAPSRAPLPRRIRVFVATNENRPEELVKMREMGLRRQHQRKELKEQRHREQWWWKRWWSESDRSGSESRHQEAKKKEEVEEMEERELEWMVLDHERMRTIERLGVFGPMMVEQVLMAEAEALVGVKMSTFSRVAGYRQRDWYGRRILYF